MSQEVQIQASFMVEEIEMDMHDETTDEITTETQDTTTSYGSCEDIWPFEICNLKKKRGKCDKPYKLSGQFVYDKCMKTCGEC